MPVVIRNPSKMADQDAFAADVDLALTGWGLPAPRWLDTTVEDAGAGQTKQALADGADLVLAAGGDGTVRACASVLAGTGIPLGLLPVGTGNLLARNLDVPLSLEGATRLIALGQHRVIDLVALDGELFTVMAGAGFDAQLFEFTSDRLKSRIGWGAYAVAGLKAMRKAHPMDIELDVDGKTTRRQGIGVLVGNVGTLTGDLTLLPDAVPDDGIVDIAVLKPTAPLEWLRLAIRVVAGKRPQPWYLERFRGEVVEVRLGMESPVELDGDVVDARGGFTVRVLPRALTVCAPPRQPGNHQDQRPR
jgi:YegS/Rv2252/BmrU family lipid kinase